MIYNLKKDNYKTFNVFKDNILDPRSYFIPFANENEMLESDIRTERYASSMVAVLSGEWEFKYYQNRSDIPDEFDTEKEKLDIITVPSCWQFTGYEEPYYINSRYQFKCEPPKFPEDCPAGVYLKKFALPDAEGNYTLTFLGVASCVDVFVNGKYVGYSEGSHNTAEFDITDKLVQGENEIVAVVHKWCTGTYLECQDMFRNNGIFRDVYITKTGINSVYDIEIKTKRREDGVGRRRGAGMGGGHDEREQTLSVRRSMALKHGIVTANPPKWDSYRTLPLNNETMRLIHALPHDSLYLFPNANGEPHSPNSWSQKLGRCMCRLNEEHPEVPILTAHELRHTYGTYLRRHGADIYTIQKLLGHKDINVTAEIYVHNELDTLREAVTALENRASAAK